jgi:hypothetical protein
VQRYAISYPYSQLPPDNHHYLRRSVSDLAQVLNVTSSQLCNVSSSVDASMESASFAERLDESFTSLIQPYRYTSYEISSPLRPTTMLFGCPLPDELDGASIGQRAVAKAFEMILSSAAKKHPQSLYQAICDAHKQQGDDIKLVSTCLCICMQCLLMSLFIVSTPTGIIMGPISAEWWSRSC